MAQITLREILGHESPAISRFSIQQNFKTLETSWNTLQNHINTSVPGAAGDLSELILRSVNINDQNFLSEGSGRFNGSLTIGEDGEIQLESNGNIVVDGNIISNGNIIMTGEGSDNEIVIGSANPVNFRHNGALIEQQFSGSEVISDDTTLNMDGKRVVVLDVTNDTNKDIIINPLDNQSQPLSIGQRIIFMVGGLQYTNKTVTLNLGTTNVPNPIFGNVGDDWVNDWVEIVKMGGNDWRILGGNYRTV